MVDLPVLERWIEMAGIRWGWDARSRKNIGLPGFNENTWRLGLDRLLLGYAMTANQDQLFSQILPFEPIEGDHSRILGGITLFAESLQEAMMDLTAERSLTAWKGLLNTIIENFFAEIEGFETEVQLLHEVLFQLGRTELTASFTNPLGLMWFSRK